MYHQKQVSWQYRDKQKMDVKKAEDKTAYRILYIDHGILVCNQV